MTDRQHRHPFSVGILLQFPQPHLLQKHVMIFKFNKQRSYASQTQVNLFLAKAVLQMQMQMP